MIKKLKCTLFIYLLIISILILTGQTTSSQKTSVKPVSKITGQESSNDLVPELYTLAQRRNSLIIVGSPQQQQPGSRTNSRNGVRFSSNSVNSSSALSVLVKTTSQHDIVTYRQALKPSMTAQAALISKTIVSGVPNNTELPVIANSGICRKNERRGRVFSAIDDDVLQDRGASPSRAVKKGGDLQQFIANANKADFVHSSSQKNHIQKINLRLNHRYLKEIEEKSKNLNWQNACTGMEKRTYTVKNLHEYKPGTPQYEYVFYHLYTNGL